MNIPVVEFINYIKFQLSSGSNSDPVVATITDEEVEVLIKIHCGTLGLTFPQIPYSYMQLMSCLVRKELYWKLATSSAPLSALKVDGTELNKDQRFDHYMSLIQEVTKEYNDIMNDPSRLPEDFQKGSIKSITLVNEKPYALGSYVKSYKLPKVSLTLDNLTEEYLEVSLDLSKVNRVDYINTSIYLNEIQAIRDEYSLEANLSKGTELKYQTYDINKVKARIPHKTGILTPKYVLLEVTLKYNLKAYFELEVKPDANESRS